MKGRRYHPFRKESVRSCPSQASTCSQSPSSLLNRCCILVNRFCNNSNSLSCNSPFRNINQSHSRSLFNISSLFNHSNLFLNSSLYPHSSLCSNHSTNSTTS